ncbi:MAG TPA: bifunctional 4-hydroxy-2-oxoglutarate aldolase/2-dehydro-3-deoxy-phosphogluconate aldolase [Candidatus Saccharimonadales bacterium]|nr:bifunctional 4-hydroxy-2-oxoglutarate aldolase/2-dehydro-3-deoxy-phosphogluconate aldolase [Candidatus Saccharimonadales bacterium]
MPSHAEIVACLLNPGVIPVIRADNGDHVLPVCEALVAAGITALEITLTTPNALASIREASRRFAGQAVTGAGSVTNADMCRATIEAGAQFIVTPIMRPEIAQVAKAAGCAVVLGAFTPTEAQLAYEAGADFVKIFPAEGAAYIKALRAPLPHLKIIPTSGVNLHTAPEFFAAGCIAIGVGSCLISPQLLRDGNWAEITRLAREYIEIARKCRAAGLA